MWHGMWTVSAADYPPARFSCGTVRNGSLFQFGKAVPLVDEDHLDIGHVGVHREMIFGNVCIHDAAKSVVEESFLVQRHSDAPHYAAHDLAGRGLGVQDASGRDRADDSGDSDYAELLIDFHVGEYC